MFSNAKYAIWPYQQHYQMTVEAELQQVLSQLNSSLVSRALLVGLAIDPAASRAPVSFEPSDTEVRAEDFADAPAVAAELAAGDAKRIGEQGDASVREFLLRDIEEAAWRRATHRAVDARCGDAWRTFVSRPTQVNGYMVFTVAQVERRSSQAYYSLTNGYVSGTVIYRSLIESAAKLFLARCQEHLSNAHPGEGFQVTGDTEEIVRAAGRQMMHGPAVAGGGRRGLHGHFDICNTISTMLYEGTEGTGSLLFVARNHPQVKTAVRLRRETPLAECAAVRKLLEITGGGDALLCDAHAVYGLGALATDYEAAREDAFAVAFDRRFHWQLRHAGRPLMHVAFGRPALQAAMFPTAALAESLARAFPTLGAPQTRNLIRLGEQLGSLSHGAMLVVAADAESEAERLQRQCTPVAPFALEKERLRALTSIDGAVLVDTDGMCHAIGVILDGLSHERCTSDRGARYNSAVRYVCNAVGRVAVVKSEDGMVDILP